MASKIDLRKLADPLPSKAGSLFSDEDTQESPPIPPPLVVPKVTAAVVDEAVRDVLSGLDIPEEDKQVIQKLLSNDYNTEFAESLHASKVQTRSAGMYNRLKRHTINIPYVMTQDETADLVSYAPEYDLNFLGKENHDHPMAAAMRKIDSAILQAALPAGLPIKDVGGDPVQLINEGALNVHACNPDADWKDPSRGTLRNMRVRMIANDRTRTDHVRNLAQRYLAGDESFVCRRRAQDCSVRARVTRSVHVYDVPIEDWPQVMHKAGASMHIGAVLFPLAAYGSTKGDMNMVRARYEIDTDTNQFRMGFHGSASWFYSHNWLQFMRYGVDQIIETEYGRYSYKVTERRGDTLFFQILRVEPGVLPQKQHYNLPGVPMVRVEGFEYAPGKAVSSVVGRSPLMPKVHWFPQNLWLDMLQQAKMDFERGVFSFDKLYNYYRVVAPRNTINGVLVSGGQRVPQDQLVALVTHVGMCAASEVMLGQRTSRAITDQALRSRAALDDSLAKQLLKGFWSAVKAYTIKGPLAAITWLCDRMQQSMDRSLADALAAWSFEPQLREVDFPGLVGETYMRKHTDWYRPEQDFDDTLRQYMLLHENQDHIQNLSELQGLSTEVHEMLSDSGVGTGASTTVVGTTHTGGDIKSEARLDVSPEVSVMRRAAIKECMEESDLEEKKIRELCATVYKVCTDAVGQPILNLLRSRAEEYYQPDMWWVNNGVLVNSALGLDALECNFSALYAPIPDPITKSNFRTLVDDTFIDSSGKVIKEYKRLAVGQFTGWMLSMDRLLVYNGPEIRSTLELALTLQHDYVIELHQGPPGCGKTYELVQNMNEDDVAMCPVRQSADDTREKLQEKFVQFRDAKLRSRTVDSYLTNYLVKKTTELRATVLHADEGFMTHAGKWYAAAALLGVRKVIVYGDQFQIPHIQRVQASGMYVKIIPDRTIIKYITYRCPADALAAWAHIYDYRVRTKSLVLRSMSVATDFNQVVLQQGHVLMVMYQAEKKELRKLFSTRLKTHKLRIMTTHESEGKTFAHVMLFRFDTRPRSDKMSLFDQQPHVLVAMSRHTHGFVYVRTRNLGDLVDSWMSKTADPRAVAAAADMNTVGQSIQYK